MKWLVPFCAACVAVTAYELSPLVLPPAALPASVVSEATERSADLERISVVLARRAPGMGLALREHVGRAIVEESLRAGFDPLLVVAVIAVESEFQPDALSVAGAKGLMQVRPPTLHSVADREGLRLSPKEIEADPSLNVRMGVRYLKSMKDQFWGNMDLALMAYNAGPNKLLGALRAREAERYEGYVRAVRRHYGLLRRASGEPTDWTFAVR